MTSCKEVVGKGLPAARPANRRTTRYLIVKEAATECEVAPLVPRMVRVYAPRGEELDVLRVSVELPGAMTEERLKVAADPGGSPLAERSTEPANPPWAPMLTV